MTILSSKVLSLLRSSYFHTIYRVENLLPLLKEKAESVHLSSLRHSIQDLQDASAKLDEEKADAEEKFVKLLRRMHIPGRLGPRTIKRRTGHLRRAADWVKQVFGVPPPTDAELQLLSLRSADSWEEFLEYAVDGDRTYFEELDGEAKAFPLPNPIKEFIKAARRVGAANKKLIAFERGFISEAGIKDREWYRHLGVAPGKWLGECFLCSVWIMRLILHLAIGYGATTFPALTEAITYEKNVTLVHQEAKRLVDLIDALAIAITP